MITNGGLSLGSAPGRLGDAPPPAAIRPMRPGVPDLSHWFDGSPVVEAAPPAPPPPPEPESPEPIALLSTSQTVADHWYRR